MVASVLESTGLMVLAQVYIYKMVFCSVLLYGFKSWMVTGGMLKVLMGFHHWEV